MILNLISQIPSLLGNTCICALNLTSRVGCFFATVQEMPLMTWKVMEKVCV